MSHITHDTYNAIVSYWNTGNLVDVLAAYKTLSMECKIDFLNRYINYYVAVTKTLNPQTSMDLYDFLKMKI